MFHLRVFALLAFAGVLLPGTDARGQSPPRVSIASGRSSTLLSDRSAESPASFTTRDNDADESSFVSKGAGVLPNNHGQVWREYDIRKYSTNVTTTARPEQGLIDWILRETGTEVWFGEPLGILSADRDTLRVYHTPEMQQLVHDIVERLVVSKGEPYAFGLRMVTVSNPNWRSRAIASMQPVSVQSPGVDAWLMTKENAALLLAELNRRADFKELNSPTLSIPNGQSQSVSSLRPRNYVRNVLPRNNAIGFELESGQIQEGYSVQISPLMAVDETTIDAVIKCNIDQVERLVPVTIESPGSSRQAVQVQVPQVVSWRLHERFRWPSDHVLLLSCGVIAAPGDGPTTTRVLPFLPSGSSQRADALLFLEYKGKSSQAIVEDLNTASRSQTMNRGRY